MPGFDRTGPLGQGPGTGRRAGYCFGETDFYPRRGRGFRGAGLGYRGMGYGRGRGWLGCQESPWIRPVTRKEETEFLQDELKAASDRVEWLKQQIAEMEKSRED